MDIPKNFSAVERAWLQAKLQRPHNKALVPTRETAWQLRHRNPEFKVVDDQATDYVRTELAGGKVTFAQIKAHMANGRTFNAACIAVGVKTPALRASFGRRFETELAALAPSNRKQQEWKRLYLAALARGETIAEALSASGVGRATVHGAKARDPLFNAAVKALQVFNAAV